MKRARIAIGAVVIGGILAFLLSWLRNMKKYPEAPTTIFNPNNNGTIPKQKPVPTIHPPQPEEEQVMLASNIKYPTSTSE